VGSAKNACGADGGTCANCTGLTTCNQTARVCQ
jgi:hypothetical protein